jgi:cell division protein FtsI/penicillin-binding protein 2
MSPGTRWTALLTAFCLVPHAAGAATRKTQGSTSVPSARITGRRAVPRRPPGLPALVVPAAASARDVAVSEAARAGLGSTQGAVVAMDPYTGRVMTVLNPYLGLSTAYEPCSVFKIVVAVAGLTEHVITPDTVYNCAGGCWFWPGHGPINLRRALAVSCNPYFEWVGEQLGYERIQQYAHLLGLGSPTGVNLPGEAAGYLPLSVPDYRVGHLSSHAKGLDTTAIQLAVLMSAVVNGGVVYEPQLAGSAGFTPKERWRLPPQSVLGGLTDGFLSAVNEGSAASAFDPDVIVAGKTGTCAGVGWFASYAPADKPEIVTVVFVRPGTGHLASAVAGRMYQHHNNPPAATATTTAGY